MSTIFQGLPNVESCVEATAALIKTNFQQSQSLTETVQNLTRVVLIGGFLITSIHFLHAINVLVLILVGKFSSRFHLILFILSTFFNIAIHCVTSIIFFSVDKLYSKKLKSLFHDLIWRAKKS